ncbi:SGNH/GDSL hydrolase family protein [Spirulina sp. CCNP1310]|uniref:SGNH/GDSL hydrolase family protein n=1 Tax=Spirulina sp. CCNP1310 TaxID=3110249 RepID=UPI002B1EC91B|nr:SGNH/GDSL hydrolase family protein [Spirulina sp. CCNP1310]MEA5421294.1 SGNH/GDSL hydrolase family protein [Spirulina sp. CCNP1310]
MKQRWQWLGGSALIVILLMELGLRWGFGFGNPVLSMADEATGYRFQPNQRVVRFGHEVIYNAYSQRSSPVVSPKPADQLRILMTGDSVLNGGTPTDQEEIITEILQTRLTAKGINAQVLNASAGSWGIGNQWGYLRKFGRFESDLLILQIGSHDLIQPTSKGDRVGVDFNYPDHRPLLAFQEVWQRYFYPPMAKRWGWPLPGEIPAPQDIDAQWQENRRQLRAILDWSRQQNLPVWVLFVPYRVEVIPEPLEPFYGEEFLTFLAAENIPVINLHQHWQTVPPAEVEGYYRDSVHLTPVGNKAVAIALQAALEEQFLTQESQN